MPPLSAVGISGLQAGEDVNAYLVIGMRLEERKLLARYGDAYRRYRDAVPALIPHPWRRLTRRQAEAFQTDAASRGLPPSQP